jgi:beta-N-acetylhexosaminidase
LGLTQKYALKTLGRPLVLAVDQEGGAVRRLYAPFFRLPAARDLGALDAQTIWGIGRRVGQELSETGFNLNLAPVLDLDLGKGGYVGSRSFGPDPATVAEKAGAFMAGLLAGGVLSCGKHFPGLGGTPLDPHEMVPEILGPKAKFAGSFHVFRSLAKKGLPAVMTTHALYPALDPSHIATFSSRIARILRREVGFDGLLLSDDLEMGAILGRQDLGRAAVRAALAGHDLLLVCRRAESIRKARNALCEAIESDRLAQGRLLESGERLGRFLGLLPTNG